MRFHAVFLVCLFELPFGVGCKVQTDQYSANRPQLHVDNHNVDLGTIGPLVKREVAFRIENHGCRRLVLNEIRCACGYPARNAIMIPPGMTEDIMISFETGYDTGNVQKTVSFSTNDKACPRIDLIIVAEVRRDPS